MRREISKYLPVFKISFQQEFAYRLNFVMWRFRNVLQIFLIFFLWDTLFLNSTGSVLGYTRDKILTYIFGILIIKSIVLSARSVDIAGEVARGDLANYMIKPLSYIRYWFTRDLASKTLNLIFAVCEIGLLFLILKPPFFLQNNPFYLMFFVFSLIMAIVIYFLLLFLFNLFPLWFPEQAWGPTFLLGIFVDFLGGGIFPLDILPGVFQNIIYLTPFPYLIFFPLQTYLGTFGAGYVYQGILIQITWIVVISLVVRRVWNLGIKAYSFEGK